MSSAIFGLQTSYKLGYRWSFTLFLRRSARCSSWVQGELGSAPTYLATIFWFQIDLFLNMCFIVHTLLLPMEKIIYLYIFSLPFICLEYKNLLMVEQSYSGYIYEGLLFSLNSQYFIYFILFFVFYFSCMFIKAGESETKEGL